MRRPKKILIFLVTLFYAKNSFTQANKPISSASIPAPTVSVYSPSTTYSFTSKINYIQTKEALGRFTSDSLFDLQTFEFVKQKILYVDGLGREIQTVTRQASPGGTPHDIIAPIVYDSLGREIHKFMPYVANSSNGKMRLNPFVEDVAFLENQLLGEQVFYTKTEFERSSLNRIIKSYSQGNSWAGSGRGVENQYMNNGVSDSVRIWTIGYEMDFDQNIPQSLFRYPAGQLTKTIVIDEHSNKTLEYKDKDGLLLLKKVQVDEGADAGHDRWLSTYYVYDDFGLLRFVIPPKAVKIISGNWTIDTLVANEVCFHYEYDHRNRMIAKKIPGAGWTYMVYDQRDRLVFSQDANMRARNQWLTTLYDKLDRQTLTGMILFTHGRDSLQNYVRLNTGGGTVSSVVVTGPVPYTAEQDIMITSNQPDYADYKASKSVTMDVGFSTDETSDFTAEIVTITSDSLTQSRMINDNPLPNSSFIALTINYYDDYSWASNSYSTTYNSYLDAGTNLHAETLPSSAVQVKIGTKGLTTGSSVRTLPNPDSLATGKWLSSSFYFDDRKRLIQSQIENNNGGKETITNLYDFSGKILSSFLEHSNPQEVSGQQTTRVRTTMEYDVGGRLLKIWKTIKFDPENKILIAQHSYDSLGQLQSKKLGLKADSSTFLETLDYTYNVRGWMNGINKAYSNSYTSTNRWFGMELNYDWGFDHNEFNGNISGIKWRSKGDGEQRTYGFGYDRVNRILFADFAQASNGSYADNNQINFDMLMGNGLLAGKAYDENGNIKSIQHWGVKVNSSSTIDSLTYTYASASNKLVNILDGSNDPQTKLGDFRTSTMHSIGHSGTTVDYSYDANGNMVKDLNKDIGDDDLNGIVYNHLNLPWKIKVKGKGYITYLYDATGNKLEKKVTDSSYTDSLGLKIKTTQYIGAFVYENNALQFFGHEEGRTRPKLISNAASHIYSYCFDYFIKDHLGSVRVVLTDEQQQDIYPAATLEGTSLSTDPITVEKLFYTIDPSLVVISDTITGYPHYPNNNGIWNNNPNCNDSSIIKNTDSSHRVYKLNSNGAKMGLGITLKVMSGDTINIFGKSFYNQNNTGGGSSNSHLPILDIITGLLGSNTGAAVGKATSSQLIFNNDGTILPIQDFLNNSDRDDSTALSRPRAAINWILLDERFNYVTGGFSMVGNTGTLKSHYDDVSMQNIEIKKSGYLYVFCSNESPINVYFDNVQLLHSRGPLLEESHYYPFGMRAEGICSKSASSLINKYQYNGKELQQNEFSGAGLEWIDYGARMYDHQICRWHVIDALIEKMSMWSPYNYTFNNPIKFVDLGGLEPFDPGKWKSADAAALAWAKSANGLSIKTNVEFSALIYSQTVKEDGKDVTYYSYTQAVYFDRSHERDRRSPAPDDESHVLPAGATAVGFIHSHGAAKGKIGVDQFSTPENTLGESDADLMIERTLDFYLATPYGNLRVNRKESSQVLGELLATGLDRDPSLPAPKKPSQEPEINKDAWRGDYDINPVRPVRRRNHSSTAAQ